MILTSQDGQSILDVTLQSYGNLENLIEVIDLNDLSLAQSLPNGTQVTVNPDDRGDQEVRQFFTRNRVTPNNAQKVNTGFTTGAFVSVAFTEGYKIGK